MNLRKSEAYAICSIDDLPKVDFSQVGETDEMTVRRSLDLTQFLIKWNDEPTFIADETIIPISILNHTDAVNLMTTEAWELPYPEPDET